MVENIKPFVDWILASAGLAGLIWGIFTYKGGQTVKRADTMFPLIKEFDEKSSEMFIAKEILDEKRIPAKDIFDDKTGDPTEYDKRKLDVVLRYDEERNFTRAEEKIRSSFDSLLDFFSKLDYLLKIKILKEQDIKYFDYYISRAVKIDAIIIYIKAYRFPFHGYLHDRLYVED